MAKDYKGLWEQLCLQGDSKRKGDFQSSHCYMNKQGGDQQLDNGPNVHKILDMGLGIYFLCKPWYQCIHHQFDIHIRDSPENLWGLRLSHQGIGTYFCRLESPDIEHLAHKDLVSKLIFLVRYNHHRDLLRIQVYSSTVHGFGQQNNRNSHHMGQVDKALE